jgi:hypothetical protein
VFTVHVDLRGEWQGVLESYCVNSCVLSESKQAVNVEQAQCVYKELCCRLAAEELRINTRSVQEMDVFSKVPLTAWEPTLLPVQWVKRLGCETDHCDVSAETKNEWSYTVTTPYAFVACRGMMLLLQVKSVNRFDEDM